MKRSRSTSTKLKIGSIWDLPGHILMEIISRLPVKTISNCRCVCKSWSNIISDPYFAKLHLSRSPISLMLISGGIKTLYLVESIESYFVGGGGGHSDDIRIPDDAVLKFNTKFDIPSWYFEVLSPCNGLICLFEPRTYNPYYICNPVMNEYVVVPQIEKDLFVHAGSGFGFSTKTNQYKVLRFSIPRSTSGLCYLKLEIEIVTLGTNLWRKVGHAPRYLHWFSSGFFLNGALHWIVHDANNCFESMCCFDFGDEQFRPFPDPSHLVAAGNESVNGMNVGLFGGCLSICHYSSNGQFDLWVMKHYGVKESWVKEFVVEPPTNYSPLYQPIMFLNNRELLMLWTLSVLVSCNTMHRSFRNVRINGLRDRLKAMTYIPSFVSVKDAVMGQTVKDFAREDGRA